MKQENPNHKKLKSKYDKTMATFRTYKCRKCGCEVQTEPHGHYALMSGRFYNF